MPNIVYNKFKEDLMNADADLEGGTFKVLLLKDTYSPDPDNATLTAIDLTTNQTTGTGYTSSFDYATGPKILTTATVTKDDTNDLSKWTADNVTWSSSTITARYAVIYRHVDGTQGNDIPCVLVDFGSNKSSSAGDFTIQWNTDGILTIS